MIQINPRPEGGDMTPINHLLGEHVNQHIRSHLGGDMTLTLISLPLGGGERTPISRHPGGEGATQIRVKVIKCHVVSLSRRRESLLRLK